MTIEFGCDNPLVHFYFYECEMIKGDTVKKDTEKGKGWFSRDQGGNE